MKEIPGKPHNIQLDRVVFFGRTLSEYVQFFDLDLTAWQGKRILDCPSGAASFVAEANQMGIQVVGCDRLFNLEPEILYQRGQADIDRVIEQTAQLPDLFNWEVYQSNEGLKNFRNLALEKFAQDYPDGRKNGRYINGSLPQLPFTNDSFDLVLSGHFLFIYGEEAIDVNDSPFGYQFHRTAILELLRVSSQEVRIYPIQNQGSQYHSYLEPLLAELTELGITTEILTVPWEFKKGSNQMLRLIKKNI